MTRAPILSCVAALLLLASPVHAEASAEERAAADALYSQASELMKANRFAEACPKLETSQRLDPGIGTLIRLGFCYENIGRTASAWSAYNDGEALARKTNDKRADEAAGRAKALEPKLSRLLIAPTGAAPGLEVRRDGKPVDAGLWGTPVPVDPGEHAIEASAPHRQPWKGSARVDARPGTTTITIPVLLTAVDDTPKDTPTPPYWNGQRVAGVVVGGAGLVGIVVGSVFGVRTFSKNSASMPYCPTNPTMCSAPGVALRNDAYAASTVSTVAFIGGGIALASGVITFLTATRTAPKSVGLVATPRSLAVQGGW